MYVLKLQSRLPDFSSVSNFISYLSIYIFISSIFIYLKKSKQTRIIIGDFLWPISCVAVIAGTDIFRKAFGGQCAT